MKKPYIKNCPQCGATQEYSRKDHYNQAVKLNRVCRACSNRNEESNGHSGYYEEMAISWFDKFARQAEARGYCFDLTKEFIWNLYESNNRLCALSGIPIGFSGRANGNTISIDRIDSSIGYTEDNIQLVHPDVNMMKQQFSQEHFIEMCKNIAQTN